MRVLFVVLSRLDPHLGASQMALNLAAALRAHGVDVTVWTPHPVPAGVPWWRQMSWVRKAIVEYVDAAGPFDAIDLPPVAASGALARRSSIVARDVQPDLRYLWCEIRHGGGMRRPLRWLSSAAFNAYLAGLVVGGWFHARRILCLGGTNHEWMRRWLPWWRGKTAVYLNAIDTDLRRELARAKRERAPRPAGGIRYLWLGRWAAHKGTDAVADFAARHLRRFPGDSITIAGCGPQAISRLPADLVASGKIRVIESYERSQLAPLLASHDTGLFTSRTEGWGLTLQEMLESGMPVHATTAGAVQDLRAFFSAQLFDFPPAGGGPAPAGPFPDAPGEYFVRCSWDDIAARYLEEIHALGR